MSSAPPPLPPPFEPFRAVTVEPLRPATLAVRRAMLAACNFNLFRVPAEMVAIDLLTDSGTGAMSADQWSAMMRGDESYAGSASYYRLVQTLARLTGFTNVLPVHQGRVAERLLVETIIGGTSNTNSARGGAGGGGGGAGMIVPNNAHFDTTRHMIEASGAEAVNLLCAGGDDPDNDAPFKGDMDVDGLQRLLKTRGDDVPFVMLTVTCNSNGGQPVSLANMHAVREVCDRFGRMLILDACRFAENAWFVQQREQGQSLRPVSEIVREMFDLCDGVAMSTRKDGLCNCGGLLLLRDDNLHRKACRLCVLTRGFQMTYGSLPGRDLEAIAVGLQEVMDETYLAQRAAMILRLAAALQAGGVKIVKPAGGHAVFIDAADFCPHLPFEIASHALACALYEQAGIRSTPIGSVLLRPEKGSGGTGVGGAGGGTGVSPVRVQQYPVDLVRLAIPRRRYTQAQLDYVAQAIVELRRPANAAAIEARPLPHDLEPAPPTRPARQPPETSHAATGKAVGAHI